MVKLGIICFANDGGLGAQTRRLTYMLKPDRVLVIDSSGFSKNKKQHFDWYENFQGYKVNGFPTNREIKVFLDGITHVLVCENPLNFYLLTEAKRMGVKVYIQSNYEFCDHLNNHLEMPEMFLMPSHWHVDTMKERFGHERVDYLPPPIDPNEFREAREINFAREGSPKLLHIVGTLAAHDRNGTLDLLQALKHTDSNFDLVIKSQHPLPDEYMTDDRRVRYNFENVTDSKDLYKNFDALILPRRYGGLSLGCNEALMSGLPVIMTDISPNNSILPKEWLVPAYKASEFMTRTMIDIYACDPEQLAKKIDWFLEQDVKKLKLQAFELGYNSFSTTVLKPQYESLWNK